MQTVHLQMFGWHVPCCEALRLQWSALFKGKLRLECKALATQLALMRWQLHESPWEDAPAPVTGPGLAEGTNAAAQNVVGIEGVSAQLNQEGLGHTGTSASQTDGTLPPLAKLEAGRAAAQDLREATLGQAIALVAPLRNTPRLSPPAVYPPPGPPPPPRPKVSLMPIPKKPWWQQQQQQGRNRPRLRP